jgi:hypothetical protein
MSDDASLGPLGSGPEKSEPGDAELLHLNKTAPRRRRSVIVNRFFLVSYHHYNSNIHHHHLIMTTSLDLLKQTGTVVVSDSGDFECAFHVHFCD